MGGPQSDRKMNMVGNAADGYWDSIQPLDGATKIGVEAVLPIGVDGWKPVFRREDEVVGKACVGGGHCSREFWHPCRGAVVGPMAHKGWRPEAQPLANFHHPSGIFAEFRLLMWHPSGLRKEDRIKPERLLSEVDFLVPQALLLHRPPHPQSSRTWRSLLTPSLHSSTLISPPNRETAREQPPPQFARNRLSPNLKQDETPNEPPNEPPREPLPPTEPRKREPVASALCPLPTANC